MHRWWRSEQYGHRGTLSIRTPNRQAAFLFSLYFATRSPAKLAVYPEVPESDRQDCYAIGNIAIHAEEIKHDIEDYDIE